MLPDDAFAHDGQITKQTMRAVTLAALAPRPGELLWDVGAGSGSIAIEWCRSGPGCRGGGIRTRRATPQADRRQRGGVRRQGRGAFRRARGVRLRATAVGDLHRRRPDQAGLLDACFDRLPAGGRLVANAVTAESEAVLAQWYSRLRRRAAAISALPRRAARQVHRLASRDARDPVGGHQGMTVYFIGAGPGAADLITVRGQRLLSSCPVCLYAGSIMPDDLLALCPPDARVVDTGPLTLDQIIGEIADANAAGLDVARLHSGDPSLYSALAEQCRRLDALGVDYEIVPGRTGFRGGRGRARTRADRARRRADRDVDAGRDAVDGDAAGGGPRDVVGVRRDAGAAPGRRSGRRRSFRSCWQAATAPKRPVRWWHSRAGRSRSVLRCTLGRARRRDACGRDHQDRGDRRGRRAGRRGLRGQLPVLVGRVRREHH